MSIEFKQTTLANGLTIMAELAPAAHSAAMGFFVKTGARDEQPEIMGVSHFLEHMMFKGTEKRTAEAVDREFDDLGAEHNAFTSGEMTAFWAHCLPEHLPKASEILADILRPALRQEDFDAEKKVILEEIAMYQDHPFWVLYERALEVYYGRHPLGHRVLGTPETIDALTRDQMAEYFQRRYSADNTVVALAGCVDFDRIVEEVARSCGDWQATGTRREYPSIEPSQESFTLHKPNVHRHYTLMIAPGPDMNDDRRYAAAMLAHILGDVDGSRLYWALIETGLAEEAQAQHDGHDGTGISLVFAASSPEKATDVERVIREEIDRLAESLTEDDLERVRSKIATGATLQGELPGGRMRRLGQLRMYTEEYRSLESEVARMGSVTLDELREVAVQFPMTPLVTGHMAPAESSAAAAGSP